MKIDFRILEKLWDNGLYMRECVRPSDKRYKSRIDAAGRDR